MEHLKCPIKECGAEVLLARVKGETILLNPSEVEVVVKGEDGAFSRVRGFLPHGMTCLDISQRPKLNRQ